MTITASGWSPDAERRSIAALRSLSVDQVQAAGIGHIGLPLGAAPVLHTVFGKYLVADPGDPGWIGRDRFVLSAGHGSALLYATLHLAGYGIGVDDLRAFRRWGSITPGHPEAHITPGVDATTGPLGQGIANAVGMAVAERMAAERFNAAGPEIFGHRTWALVSDGDLMEGVALEAIAFAGVQRLGGLVAFYDDNDIVIDGRASAVHDASATCAAIAAQGWHVSEAVDGEDLAGLAEATEAALADERPSLIRVRTVIGRTSRLADTPAIHSGAVTAEEAAHIKLAQGEDFAEPFAVPDDVRDAWRVFRRRGEAAHASWNTTLEEIRSFDPRTAERIEVAGAPRSVDVSSLGIERPSDAEPIRKTSGRVLGAVSSQLDDLVGGSADLASATMAVVPDGGVFSPDDRGGRNIAFGIREHAMGAICNGIALHGVLRPFASTFMVFATYQANALRMAALQGLPVIHVLTHDSITVGEDGPTHQPIEQLATFRATPNTLVLRPADAEETEAVWQAAVDNTAGPSIIAASRTALPQLDHSRRIGSPSRGAYVLRPADGTPELCIVASGSEVSIAVAAAALLAEDGIAAGVVSMPSWELFERQPDAYRSEVLPPGVPRLVVEASSPLSLWRIAGAGGRVHAIDRFGASASPERMLREYGFTPEAVATAARELVLAEIAEVVS